MKKKEKKGQSEHSEVQKELDHLLELVRRRSSALKKLTKPIPDPLLQEIEEDRIRLKRGKTNK